MKKTYTIDGMTCSGCKASVEKHLKTVKNIISASVNLEKKEVEIENSSFVSIEKLQDILPEKFSIFEKEKETVFNAIPNSASSKSELKQLKPLFIIFGYITITSLLLHYKNWSWDAFMLDFMGLFYIVFSFFKLLDLKGFSKSFAMYDPLAKTISGYGFIYPFIEVALGLLFLFRFKIPIALMITLTVLGMTTIGVTKTLLDKKTIPCACLGTVLKLPMTKATFIENTIMIVMAVIMGIKTYSL